MCMVDPDARAHGKEMRVRVVTNRAGILLAIMHPGQLKKRLISLTSKDAHKNSFPLQKSFLTFIRNDISYFVLR